MLLYHFNSSTCSQKVRLVLAEKGAGWESRLVDLHQGGQFDPAYLALNPAGVVPTLVVDGTTVLRESSVINEFLEETCPGAKLMPATGAARAAVRLWIRRLDDEIHPAAGALTYASTAAQRRARMERQGLSIQQFLARVPDASRRRRQEDVLTHGVMSEVAQDALATFRDLLRDMNTALLDGGCLVGGSTTLADLSFVPYILRIHQLGLEKRLVMPSALAKWFDAHRSRTSFAEAIGKWSDPAAEAALLKVSTESWDANVDLRR